MTLLKAQRMGVAVLLGVVACQAPAGQDEPTPTTRQSAAASPCPQASVPPVDASLLAFLSRARAAHVQADLAESSGDVPRAMRALEGLLRASRPGTGDAPELREVLADTHGRLAELRARGGDEKRALTLLQEGLRLVPEETYYRGRLFELVGAVQTQRYKRLRAAGKTEAAAQAKKRAKAALKKAIAIQDAVVRARLPKPSRVPPER